MTAHQYAELFPMMADDELRELAEDIKLNGQHEDIVTLDDKILDGRNRYRACEMAGVEPMVRGYLGDDPLAFVLSKNLKRRHLSESQRAMVAASLAKIEHGHNRYESKSKVDAGIPASTQSAAAKALNVSRDSVQQARKVQDSGSPELVAAVKAGTVSVNAAAEVAKLPKDEQKEIVAKGPEAVKEAAKKKRKARQKDKPEPVSEPKTGGDGKNTGVQVPQEPPAAEEPAEDESTVMGKLNALLKQVKQLVKKNPLLAKDAAVAIHEVGEEVILFTPELKYGETRPLYESSYFRLKDGKYEGPHVQRLEGIGIKAIDTYGRMVPQELRDEFCEKRYQQVARHLQEAVMQLHAADEIYKTLTSRGHGVPWFPDEEWNKMVMKGSKLVSDGLSAWMFDALPYSICLFCNGHKKDDKGMRCLKCKFTGYWPKNEVNAHPTMIKDMRPKVAATQEAKA